MTLNKHKSKCKISISSPSLALALEASGFEILRFDKTDPNNIKFVIKHDKKITIIITKNKNYIVLNSKRILLNREDLQSIIYSK